MKRFRFPLRPVAILRAHQELRAREAFAHAVQAFVRAEQEAAAARQRVVEMERALTDARGQRFSAAAEVNNLLAYRQECAVAVEAEKAVLAAQEAMNTRRAEYIEAHRRLEVVHRLEEKARHVHRHETMREEQAEFDDYAGRRFSARAVSTS